MLLLHVGPSDRCQILCISLSLPIAFASLDLPTSIATIMFGFSNIISLFNILLCLLAFLHRFLEMFVSWPLWMGVLGVHHLHILGMVSSHKGLGPYVVAEAAVR